MSKKTIKVVYKEPADYFPKELREKYKLGEFAEAEEPMLEDCGGIQAIPPIKPLENEEN